MPDARVVPDGRDSSPLEGYLERLRRAELELVREHFRSGARVLEIGSGSGFQASLLAAWGCQVTALDVPNRPAVAVQYHPITTYDGAHLPFPTASFDVVFSSNVLEHVHGLATLLRETRRVLPTGGLGIHFMPSATWRLWTSLAHYPYLIFRRFDRADRASATHPDALSAPLETATRRGHWWSAGPHGEYSSAWAELYYFRRARWVRLLRTSGFEALRATGNGLFYTGYTLLPSLPMSWRRAFSRGLGSSCHVFVLRAV